MRYLLGWLAACVLGGIVGCGTTKSQRMTDQLVLSDAVDRTIAQFDFRVLAGKQAYLDTQFLKPQKTAVPVNANYIISSLRQQLFAANVRLTEKKDEAEYVVEPRVGALGTDDHEISYGVPASSAVATAASFVASSPPIPVIPELSLARRREGVGGVKLAVFAYERKSKRPVWQSGIKTARANARFLWVLGAGPFQQGTIFKRTQFAGNEINLPLVGEQSEEDGQDALVDFNREHTFSAPVVEYQNPIQFSKFDKAQAGGKVEQKNGEK